MPSCADAVGAAARPDAQPFVDADRRRSFRLLLTATKDSVKYEDATIKRKQQQQQPAIERDNELIISFERGSWSVDSNTSDSSRSICNSSNMRKIHIKSFTCQRLLITEKSKNLSIILSMITILLLSTTTTLIQCSMCQYHQAMLTAASAASPVSGGEPKLAAAALDKETIWPSGSQSLIVCPKSSQYNNLPQFPPKYMNPNLERQQREILKHLNASFANHLQLNGNNHQLQQQHQQFNLSHPTASAASVLFNSPTLEHQALASEMIDDELLNEIISPLVVDAAYERAKELIVKRRKLEGELIKQGNYLQTCRLFSSLTLIRDTLLWNKYNCNNNTNLLHLLHLLLTKLNYQAK